MTTSEVRTLPGLGPTGARPGSPGTAGDGAATPAALTPATFSRAVATMTSAVIRPGVRVEPVRPPQRLAPWSHAVAA